MSGAGGIKGTSRHSRRLPAKGWQWLHPRSFQAFAQWSLICSLSLMAPFKTAIQPQPWPSAQPGMLYVHLQQRGHPDMLYILPATQPECQCLSIFLEAPLMYL